MTRKPVIYIAGPLSLPDPCTNTHKAMKWWDFLQNTGLCVPVCPHWSMLQHTFTPRPYEEWIQYDLDLLNVCDALLRIPGESPGADGEVARMKELGKPVFTMSQQPELFAWCEAFMGRGERKEIEMPLFAEVVP